MSLDQFRRSVPWRKHGLDQFRVRPIKSVREPATCGRLHLPAHALASAGKETAMTDQSPAYHYAVVARALKIIDAAGPGLTLEKLGLFAQEQRGQQ